MKKIIFYLLLCTGLAACSNQKKKTNVSIALNQNWILIQEKTKQEFTATVPGCVHTDLLNNKIIGDPFYRTNEKTQQWIDKEDWSYVTEFEADAQILARENIELIFKGLDTYADVYLNDSLLLKADNMFREWNVNCKNVLKEGKNNLKIYFHSPITIGLEKLAANGYALPAVNDQSENGELGDKRVSPFTRKAPYHYGWDWGPRFVTSGIWRPVLLNAWDNAKIENVQIIQNEISEKTAKINEIISIQSSKEQEVEIMVQTKNLQLFKNNFSLKTGDNKIHINYTINNPELWWTNGLGKQNLYKIETSVHLENQLIEKDETSIGLRTLKLVQKPDESGSTFYFELNGMPVFMKGANHIPNDIFLPRITTQVYEHEIKTAAESNMNMIRVWGGGIYEDDRFYDLCDQYGILVWQDFMFACSMYPGDEEFLESVKYEAIDNVTRLRNHPSIALWCGNNEIDAAWSEYSDGGWGWKKLYNNEQHKQIWENYEKIFHQLLPEIIEKYDSVRSYWPSSPMAGPKQHAGYDTKSGDMHYWGVWHGKEPFSEFEKKRARFMSEYGFQSFPEFNTVKKYALPEDFNIESEVMAAHQRSGIGNLRIKEYMSWYYKEPKDFEKFLYVGQVLQAEGIKAAIEAHRRDKPFNMGTLYWQLNDCWPVASWSGMDYYGNWKALQYFTKKAYANVLVSPVFNNDTVKIHIISDRLINTKSKLVIEIIDFDGNSLYNQSTDIEVIANSSKSYVSVPDKRIKEAIKDKNCVLIASLFEDGQPLSSNKLYFAEIKNLSLPKATITHEISKKDDIYLIKLSTDKLAKNIYLSLNDKEGFFSDNYFDLIPGKPVEITLKTTINEKEVAKDLKVISLVDSY